MPIHARQFADGWKRFGRCRGRGVWSRREGQDVQETGIDALVLILRFHELAVDPAQIRHRYANVPFGVSEILHCAKELKLKFLAVGARGEGDVLA